MTEKILRHFKLNRLMEDNNKIPFRCHISGVSYIDTGGKKATTCEYSVAVAEGMISADCKGGIKRRMTKYHGGLGYEVARDDK